MKRFTLSSLWLSVAAGFLCLAMGCAATHQPGVEGGAGPTPTAIVIAPVTSEPDPLDGTRWELMSFESRERTLHILEQPRLFVKFEKGALTFRGGCNRIAGYYVLENEHITITFAEGTLVDCSSDSPKSWTMEVEEAFLSAMPAFESYTIADDLLHINHASGKLLFRRASD